MKSSRLACSSLSTFSASARRALLFVSTAFILSAPACWQSTLMGRCEKGASFADPCGDASPSFHSSR